MQVTGGTVNIRGGKYDSAGNGIDIDSGGRANITGGTFKADGALLRYENNPVSEMLPVGYALQEVGGSKVQVNALKVLTGGNEGQFADEGKSYEVVPCTHEVRACSTNGDGTHNNTNCAYCRYQDTSASTSTPHTYDPVSGKCSECQSLLVASATVEGENILYYETLDTAWSSLNNKTGTVNLLTNVSIDHQFNVNEDTNVTLTMEDGVTLTDAAPQCFYVAVGGTLTLASGAVVATRSTGQELRHLVFNGGTLYVRGGTYTSTGGDCIIVNSGATAELTGGTFQAARNGTLLSFASVGHTVSELLPENYALAKGGNENEKVLLTALKETDTNRGVFSGNGDSYTVIKCNHDNATATKNNDGSTHAKTCLCCTHVDSEDPHTWSEDDNIVCTLCSAVAQAKVEMNDAITYYSEGASTGLEYAWQAVEGKTATITLLANTTTSNTLTVNSGDITLKMADGVALTHTGSTCFEVNGGTLTLPGGVKVTSSTGTLVDAKSGTLRVVGGEYTLGENTNGFVVGSGVDAKFSGGTIKLGTSSGNVLKYTGGQVKGLLETGYCLVKDGEAYRLDQLGSEVLSGLTGVNSLTLELCTHTTIENDQCALCGLKMVAKVAIGDDITYYDKLLDAWQAIQGKTAVLTLLNTAEAAETLTLSSGEVTLNMQEGVALNGTLQATGGKLQITGGKIGALTVSGDAQVSLSGGSFKSIHSDAPVARLLAAGYAYKQGNNWVYDTSSTSISSVEVATMVKLIPVEITAQPVDGTKTYGDTVTLSVTAQTVGGENDGKAITYQWYQVGESGSTAIASATGDTYSPVKLNAGAHKFYCAVICDEYMVKSSTVTVTVNPKPLTPSITGTATKNYDGTTDVTAELFIALAGVVTGDEVTATATYAYDNENAGENKTITASDIKLTGEDAGNYTLTLPTEGVTATGTISPLEITVTPDSGQHKEYGAADPALTYTVNPSLIGDDKLSGKLAYIGSAVGKYEITPGSLDVPTENYTLIVTTGVTFEITKANQAALHITGKPSGNIIYGDTFQLSTDGGSGTGTVIWTATGGATVDGSGNVTVNGTESATITATKAEDTNYEPTSTTLTFTPAKKALTVTGAAAENRAYNGTNRVTITGVTLAGIVNSDNVSVNTTGLTGTISGADAGDYTAVTLPVLTLTGGAAGNYTLTQPTKAVNTSVKVSKALASVLTPKDGDLAVANKRAYSYTYGLGALRPDLPAGMSFGSSAVTYELGAVSLGSYYGGSGAKIEGQTLTLPIEAVDNDKAEVIGTITVTIKSDNFEDMTATINVRSVNKTIPTGAPTLSAATLTYGQSLSTITLSGSMKDGSADVPGTFTWSSPDNRPAVQEAYAAAWVFKPDDNNTYAIVNGTSTIKVVPASVTGAVVTLSPTSFRYDGQTHSPTVTSVKLGDTTLTADTDYTVEIPTETAAGTYTVTVTGKGNYTGTAAATFTINPVEQKPLDQTDNAGHELRLEVETGLSTVPEALMNNETYNTPEKIEADLRTKVADVMTNVGENIAVFDVTLQYKDESGTWRTVVDPNDFPVEGVTAILPYPAGTGATGYTFTVQHLISSGTQAGTMETLSYTLTADGLQCKFSSLSPVAIGYQAAAKPVEPVDPNPGGGGVSTYAVTVEKSEHGKVTSNRTNAGNGSTVTLTVTPDSGYVLDTLTVTDSRGGEIKLAAQGNGKYTFTMPGRAVTVKAAFAPLPDGTACDGGESCPSRGFTDLGSVGTWYHEAVDYVLRNNLMGGYGNGMFGPNDNITRAQFAQILYNKEGRPNLTGGGIFTDVAPGAWCAPAITWAAEHGIVGGYGDGMFGPNDKITREQLAVMLWRYAGNPAATNKELHFNDANEISGFALEALQWAVENGVMGGYDDGRLDPKGLATRAQVAQMFKNFMESQEEVED